MCAVSSNVSVQHKRLAKFTEIVFPAWTLDTTAVDIVRKSCGRQTLIMRGWHLDAYVNRRRDKCRCPSKVLPQKSRKTCKNMDFLHWQVPQGTLKGRLQRPLLPMHLPLPPADLFRGARPRSRRTSARLHCRELAWLWTEALIACFSFFAELPLPSITFTFWASSTSLAVASELSITVTSWPRLLNVSHRYLPTSPAPTTIIFTVYK